MVNNMNVDFSTRHTLLFMSILPWCFYFIKSEFKKELERCVNLTGENSLQECLTETERVSHYNDDKTTIILVAFIDCKRNRKYFNFH